ncbi:unnamed protein product [Ectocarpus sp. CCAP 1310/34]|nr:unnamed protein product [Ectocarpus sp. CCAP 1310/34]
MDVLKAGVESMKDALKPLSGTSSPGSAPKGGKSQTSTATAALAT